MKPTPPFIPGHEGAGVVAAVGPGVTDLKISDPVGIAWLHDACGGCEFCETGWETLCEKQHMSGYTVNGSFAEYAIGSAAYVARLPKNVDFAEMAPILCAGVTTYKGIKETEAKPGEWIAISGIGGLGACRRAVCQGDGPAHRGAGRHRGEACPGAHARRRYRHQRAGERCAEQVIEATSGGAHGVLVTAVSTQAFAQAIRVVRRKGTVSLNGLPPGDFPTPIFDVVLKRITLRGSIVGTRKDLRRQSRLRRRARSERTSIGQAGRHQYGVRRSGGWQG